MFADSTSLVHLSATISLALLVVALFAALLRLMRGPALPDRVVALDLVSALVIGIIAAYCVLTGISLFLNAAALLALISFLGTVAFARYLEKGIR